MALKQPDWLYPFFRGMLTLLFRIFHRWDVHGAENIPLTGGCLIASNHASFMDPPAVGCASRKRMVRFMARDTLFKKGVGEWLMKGLHAIPISRDRGDVGALKRCIQFLRKGDCVAIFPEGTRSRDGSLGEAKAGIGFLIMSAGVPVVPVYIAGTFAAFPRGASWPRPYKVRVYIGKPIPFTEFQKCGEGRDSYGRVANLVMDYIKALHASA